jgi:hypothetical protein
VRERNAERCRDLADRAPFEALQRHDSILTERAFLVAFEKVGVAATFGALADELVDALERFPISRTPGIACGRLAEKTPN